MSTFLCLVKRASLMQYFNYEALEAEEGGVVRRGDGDRYGVHGDSLLEE